MFKRESIEISSNIVAYEKMVHLIELAKRLLMVDGPRVLNDIAAMSGYLDKHNKINSVRLSNHEDEGYMLVVNTTSFDNIEGEDVIGDVYVSRVKNDFRLEY